jgi:hypothetical protein
MVGELSMQASMHVHRAARFKRSAQYALKIAAKVLNVTPVTPQTPGRGSRPAGRAGGHGGADRTGNQQLNCAIHRIAVTQKRCHPPAQPYLNNRIAAGNAPAEALRALKRRISDAVYRNLQALQRNHRCHTTQPGSLTWESR